MKVVVTGGSGRLGQLVIQELLNHEYEVLSLDRVISQGIPCPSWAADLRRIGDLYGALKDAEGVVHLGAYQAPNLTSDGETFSNNVSATYNVIKVASDLKVKHVVVASSVAAYGFLYAYRFWPPNYLPLDEDHPCRPQDPYGLSKVTGEQVADGFADHINITIASLRLAGVNFEPLFQKIQQRWETPEAKLGGFWCYIDGRDAAVACRLALEARFMGHEVINICAPTSTMSVPTQELIRRYLPTVKDIREKSDGNWSGVASSKAGRLLGFTANHRWENVLKLS